MLSLILHNTHLVNSLAIISRNNYNRSWRVVSSSAGFLLARTASENASADTTSRGILFLEKGYDMTTQAEKNQAMLKFIQAIGQCSNLIGTDIEDANAYAVSREFVQSKSGVLVQFVISDNALGKTGPGRSAPMKTLGLTDEDRDDLD